MWENLLSAICLMLVIEGIIPFLYPKRWRNMVEKIALVNDKTLRITGLISMLVGTTLLYLVKHFSD